MTFLPYDILCTISRNIRRVEDVCNFVNISSLHKRAGYSNITTIHSDECVPAETIYPFTKLARLVVPCLGVGSMDAVRIAAKEILTRKITALIYFEKVGRFFLPTRLAAKGAQIRECSVEDASRETIHHLIDTDDFDRERLLRNVEFYIAKGAEVWNDCMCAAARIGRRDLVDLFISKGAKIWEVGMWGAARGGHLELVEFFAAKGANDWDACMGQAAYRGHRDLVEYFISKGASDWDIGLNSAAMGNQEELVIYFIEKGARRSGALIFAATRCGYKSNGNMSITAANFALRGAVNGDQREIVELLVSRGANDWNSAMEEAAKTGNQELVEYFVDKGADNWDGSIELAAKNGYIDLVDYFIEKKRLARAGAVLHTDTGEGKQSSGAR